jgi:hypothetical protein
MAGTARAGTGISAEFAQNITGGVPSDFKMTFSGTLSTIQNNLIIGDTKASAVTATTLDVILRTAPVGQSVKVSFYAGVTLLGQVEVLAGATSGTLAITPTVIAAGVIVTATIDQIGTTTVGETATMYVRAA